MAARFACAHLLALALVTPAAAQSSVIFEDFNVDEGHFTWAPTDSGSTSNVEPTTSTANQVTTTALEGEGSQELIINTVTPDSSTRVRHVAGGGVTANNTPFTTSPETDGWIGFALKTDSPGWNVSLWIELAPNQTGNPGGINNNAGVPQEVIADGDWHFYQWNLDDNSGGPDGWATVSGIIAGTSTVNDGDHTIDSIILRNTAAPATSTFYVDFIALNREGFVEELLEPGPEGDADFDGDGDIDGADLLVWQRNVGAGGQSNNDLGDADANGTVETADLEIWKDQFTAGAGTVAAVGAIPEPASLGLIAAAMLVSPAMRRRA
jgi:hypothetical protein